VNLAQRKNAAEDMGVSTNPHFDTRLHGPWLLAARVIWLVLALAIVVLNGHEWDVHAALSDDKCAAVLAPLR
jgi:hypothetical protein